MGARTVPLAPTRHVLIAEGASEPLILPSLIREATSDRALDYQVVGGLAGTAKRIGDLHEIYDPNQRWQDAIIDLRNSAGGRLFGQQMRGQWFMGIFPQAYAAGFCDGAWSNGWLWKLKNLVPARSP